MPKPDFSNMGKRWPSAYVARTEFNRFTGGLYTAKYLANCDSKQIGPQGRIRAGRKILYPVESVIRWLEARAQYVG